MTMTRGVTEIDRLIEQGLGLYGEGDLDGALLLWERALILEPDNAQATSYVDYVRMHYELLTSDSNVEQSGPFGIGADEPDYQIEILAGEDVVPASAAPLFMDARDEGWVIGDELGGELDVGTLLAPGSMMLELEADEPPVGGDPGTFESSHTGEGVSFEDATREYPGGAGRPTVDLLGDGHLPAEPGEFVSEITPAFGSPEDLQTPQGFGSEVTDIRHRDLGFVHPTVGGRRVAPGPPELKMTLRTPGSQVIPLPLVPAERHRATRVADDLHDHADGDDEPVFELETPPAGSEVGLDYDSLDLDLMAHPEPRATLDLVGRADTRPAGLVSADEPAALIASLPTPRAPFTSTRPPTGKPRVPAADAPPPYDPPHMPMSRELPLPAPSTLGVAMAPTQEVPYAIPIDPELAVRPAPHQAATRDFADVETSQLPGRPRPMRPDDPVISAPTRDLGLRAERRAATEDETTGHFDFHKQRMMPRGGAKRDLPGLDPIDARGAEILEDIDRDVPANETREERTRRRITVLLERATTWGQRADLERSVTAVDLALSEDPNSALAQKLIHRNRDTIMNAFQGFLGDLQRTPALARPLHELGSAPISPRAAFLLSRVDGTLSLDEILDVSGMPRLEAYRYLCQLFLRGILR
jgi:hypothetical protein